MAKKTRIGWSAAAISLALLASACGFGGAGGSSSGESGTPRVVTTTFMKSGTYDEAALAFAQQFEAAGEGTVKVDAFPYAALRQNNTNAIIGGGCPYNVVSGSYYLSSLYSKFRNLDDLAAKSNYEKALAPGLWEQSEFNEGHHIGLPYGPDSYALIYRTDLFEQAGLQVPKTWPEMFEALTVLKSRFGTQGVAPLVFSGGANEQLPALFFASYDSYFINRSNKFELDVPKAVAAINNGQRLLSFAPPDVMSQSIDAANAQFVGGNAAVLYGFPSFVRELADDPTNSKVTGKWAVGTLPQPGFVWLSMWQLYMTECTSDVDTAWDWMTTFSSAANDKELFLKYGVNPAFSATYDDPKLKKDYGHFLNGVQENLSRAKNPPLSGEAQDFLASTLGDVFTGKTTAEAAVEQVNQKWAGLSIPEPILKAAAANGLVQK